MREPARDVREHRERRRREVVVAEVVLGDPERVEPELAGQVGQAQLA